MYGPVDLELLIRQRHLFVVVGSFGPAGHEARSGETEHTAPTGRAPLMVAEDCDARVGLRVEQLPLLQIKTGRHFGELIIQHDRRVVCTEDLRGELGHEGVHLLVDVTRRQLVEDLLRRLLALDELPELSLHAHAILSC